MNIVLLAHPSFVEGQSMPRFAHMLMEAFQQRGHKVQIWSPKPVVINIFPTHWHMRKWAGYIDQYLLFPARIRRKIRQQSADTLYVFCDQALGPWVPLVRNLPHVVHVHDLLALRSALREFPEHPTQFTGRMYQRYIRWGFEKASNFISISQKTRDDLHRYSSVKPNRSEVVYNGLNYPYTPIPTERAREILLTAGYKVPESGMLMHISGNQWYKNVKGVIRVYAHYARAQANPLPLWLIGNIQSKDIQEVLSEIPAQGNVLQLRGLTSEALHSCYAIARALIFPSLEEGFGWPIIEAQACGCPVLTTAQAPMSEIGGPDCFYVPRLNFNDDSQVWASNAAATLNDVLKLDTQAYIDLRARCVKWASRFQTDSAIDGYMRIYDDIVASAGSSKLTCVKER